MKLQDKLPCKFEEWDTFDKTPWGRITYLRVGWYSDKYGLMPLYVIEHGDCSLAVKIEVVFKG